MRGAGNLLSWGNKEEGGSAGSEVKAAEGQWRTSHCLLVNCVWLYWELLEGRSWSVHNSIPSTQQDSNQKTGHLPLGGYKGAMGWVSYANAPRSPEDPCPVNGASGG